MKEANEVGRLYKEEKIEFDNAPVEGKWNNERVCDDFVSPDGELDGILVDEVGDGMQTGFALFMDDDSDGEAVDVVTDD